MHCYRPGKQVDKAISSKETLSLQLAAQTVDEEEMRVRVAAAASVEPAPAAQPQGADKGMLAVFQ